jgi:hypothetical protein
LKEIVTKKFAFAVLASFFFMTSAAWATIYLVAQDPASNSVGIACISSGPVVSYSPHAMTGVKGLGFTGWSGSVANVSRAMDKKVFAMIREGATSQQIASFVDGQIHDKYSRYIFISSQGQMGYVFPPRGCAEPECGVVVSPTRQFFVMGGGLKHDVVPNSVKMYEQIQARKDLPFECKLLAGLQAIINVGGEVKEFQEAGIGIDGPQKTHLEWFTSANVRQNGIIAHLGAEIAKLGISCPAMNQLPRLPSEPGAAGTLLDLN